MFAKKILTKSVFISRTLTERSIFSQKLSEQGWIVAALPLVELHPIAFKTVPAADWIFFASKNAVQFFFQNLHNRQIVLPVLHWAALGPATAEALSLFVDRLDFSGNGKPEAVADVLRPLVAGQTVLFPAAEHSTRSVVELLKKDCRTIEFPVYHNQALKNPPARAEQVLVFTSPMNAQAYFGVHALQSGQQVLAIGQTTAAAITRFGIRPLVADSPEESSLAAAVLGLSA